MAGLGELLKEVNKRLDGAKQAHLTKEQLDAVFDGLKDLVIEQKQRLTIFKFGAFHLYKQAGRKVTSPLVKKTYVIPERHVLKFTSAIKPIDDVPAPGTAATPATEVAT